MHTQKRPPPLAPLAVLCVCGHLHTFSSCHNSFTSVADGQWVTKRRRAKTNPQSSLGQALFRIRTVPNSACSSCPVRTVNSLRNPLCAGQGGDLKWLLLFIRNIGASSKIVHLNENFNFNPVCIIKSYPVHAMLGSFLSFKRPNLMSETEETSYFGCK